MSSDSWCSKWKIEKHILSYLQIFIITSMAMGDTNSQDIMLHVLLIVLTLCTFLMPRIQCDTSLLIEDM